MANPLTLVTSVPVQTWAPEVGDSFFFDTKANMGYLVHTDGVYTEFPVVTGKKAFVHYIGRGYRAETPSRNWVAKSLHFKGDRMTFGAANPKEYKDIVIKLSQLGNIGFASKAKLNISIEHFL